MFGLKKVSMIAKDEALPGRADHHAGARAALRERRARSSPPFPEGREQAVFGMGCFWGAERMFWQTAGRLLDRGRLRGRLHAEPDLRGGLQRHDRPHRGRCASSSIPRPYRYDDAAQASSGRATTRRRACGRATTSARSTAPPSTRTATRSARRRAPRATRIQTRADARPATARSPPRSAEARRLLLRRGLSPAVPRQEPGGYCGIGGTGVSCPVGLATSA